MRVFESFSRGDFGFKQLIDLDSGLQSQNHREKANSRDKSIEEADRNLYEEKN